MPAFASSHFPLPVRVYQLFGGDQVCEHKIII